MGVSSLLTYLFMLALVAPIYILLSLPRQCVETQYSIDC